MAGSGFDTERLQTILAEYQSNLEAWGTRKYRKKIRQLPEQVTDDEALSLLRIAEVQAIHNARAYCRGFDQISASQQMALTQLVYRDRSEPRGVHPVPGAPINQGPTTWKRPPRTIHTVGDSQYWPGGAGQASSIASGRVNIPHERLP